MIDKRGIVLDLDDLHEGWPDLLQQAGINVLGLHNWAAGSKNNAEKIDFMIKYSHSTEGSKTFETMRQRGIDIEYELHAMSWLLPREWYDRHPDWFRMNEQGERTPVDNMCPTNKEALEFVQLNSAKLAKALPPTTNRYFLWQDDNKQWCQCQKCKDYSPSDQTLLVMNAILEAIRAVRSDALLAYLAYADTLDQPPQLITPAAGIFLEMAGPIIHRSKDERQINIREDERYNRALTRNLDVFGIKNAHVLEYWLDASFFSGWKKPVPKLNFNVDRVADDIAFYKERGFQSISSFGVFLDDHYFKQFGLPPVVEYARHLIS